MDNNKKILFIFIISLLFVPILQMDLNFYKLNKLNGSFELAIKPDSIKYNWFTEKYQQQYEKYYNDNLGFRNFFVRLNNQIDYSLFNKINTELTVIGKNNNLFQSDYIESYLGYNYIGNSRVVNCVSKLNTIQQKLKNDNIEFLLIFAPGKASFMPENIPKQYDLNTKTITNYEAFVPLLKKSNINFIDFRAYFNLIKDTCKAPLFPVNGVHWSGYGSTLASDSILKYLAKLLDINTVKQVDEGGYYTSTEMMWSDDDLLKAINMFSSIKNLTMYYPKIKYLSDTTTIKPNALFMGDSYLQSFYGFYPFYKECFGDNTDYWSYNYVVRWYKGRFPKKKILVKDLDIKYEFKSRDVIIIMVTQPNIRLIDKEFLKQLSRYYNLQI